MILTGAGGPEVISLGEVPKPEVKPGHIRVRVRAAGLNRADLLQRRGHYPAPPGWPADIPGLEYAGEVEAVRDTSRWKVGDRVMGLVGGGAQAEMVVIHADEALAVPEGLSFAEAAAIPEVFLTAYDALVTRGRLRPGERVLIHAVGSGVGTAASQIARHLGATVIGTSRSADKLARAVVYGLDHGIDTSTTSFPRGDRRAGGRRARRDRRSCLRRQPRGARAPAAGWCCSAFLPAAGPPPTSVPMIRKRLEVIGTAMRVRSAGGAEGAGRRVRRAHAAALRPPNRAGGAASSGAAGDLSDDRGWPRLTGCMESNETFGKIASSEW